MNYLEDSVIQTAKKYGLYQPYVAVKELLLKDRTDFFTSPGRNVISNKVGEAKNYALCKYIEYLKISLPFSQTPFDTFINKVQEISGYNPKKMANLLAKIIKNNDVSVILSNLSIFNLSKKKEISLEIKRFESLTSDTQTLQQVACNSIGSRFVNSLITNQVPSINVEFNNSVFRSRIVRSYINSVLERYSKEGQSYLAMNSIEEGIIAHYKAYHNRDGLYAGFQLALEKNDPLILCSDLNNQEMKTALNHIQTSIKNINGSFGLCAKELVLDCFRLDTALNSIAPVSNLVINKENAEALKHHFEKHHFERFSGLAETNNGGLRPINYEKGEVYCKSLGNMHMATSVGRCRDNQEDAVLIMVHPNNPKFKLMVVADGMGGNDNGEYASHEVIKELYEWFKDIDATEYDVVNDNLAKRCSDKLKQISANIFKQYGDSNAGSTVALAIVGKENTIVENVGDSRAYAVDNNGKLNLITQDDATLLIEKRMKYGTNYVESPSEREERRFTAGNNGITQYLGMNTNVSLRPHAVVFPNNKYSALALFSDGVTDLVSEMKLEEMSKEFVLNRNSKKDIPNILKAVYRFVKHAVDNDAKKGSKTIHAGKDNASAIWYDNER